MILKNVTFSSFLAQFDTERSDCAILCIFVCTIFMESAINQLMHIQITSKSLLTTLWNSKVRFRPFTTTQLWERFSWKQLGLSQELNVWLLRPVP